MTLQLELTPAMEAELTKAAGERGVAPSTCALEMLDMALLKNRLLKAERDPMPLEEFFSRITQFSGKIPDYPGETFDRDFIYGDHP